MSDLKIVSEGLETATGETGRVGLPVPSSDAAFTRRDLDMIKRDLITVRKDYAEIRNNMVILTHQHSSTPSRGFFLTFGLCWLVLFAALIALQPLLTGFGGQLAALLHRG